MCILISVFTEGNEKEDIWKEGRRATHLKETKNKLPWKREKQRIRMTYLAFQ